MENNGRSTSVALRQLFINSCQARVTRGATWSRPNARAPWVCMIDQISFQTAARLVDHLGREQIAYTPTAISELWKNAYDA